MQKFQCLLFVLKQSYIYHYMICMTVHLIILLNLPQLRVLQVVPFITLVIIYHINVAMT